MDRLLDKLATESLCGALPLYTSGTIFKVIIDLFGSQSLFENMMNGCLYLALALTIVFIVCMLYLMFTDDND